MAARKLQVYFDKTCLIQLLSEYSEVWNLLERDIDLWLGFHQDDLFEILQTIKNPVAKKVLTGLIKDNNQRNISRQHEPLHVSDLNIDIQNPHLLFFVDKSNTECTELEQQYGWKFLNYERYQEEKDKLFNTFIFNVTQETSARNRLTSWQDIALLKQPCNALVLLDNYILKDKQLNQNLLALLEQLIPNSWLNKEQQFDLTIITSTDKIHTNIIQDRIDAIKNYFKSKLDLNINVIHCSSSDNHDRNIFTNYLWYHSGNTFSYFNDRGKIKKQTNLFYHPIWHLQRALDKKTDYDKTAFWAVANLLQEARDIVKEATNLPSLQQVWGNKQNRLLDCK